MTPTPTVYKFHINVIHTRTYEILHSQTLKANFNNLILLRSNSALFEMMVSYGIINKATLTRVLFSLNPSHWDLAITVDIPGGGAAHIDDRTWVYHWKTAPSGTLIKCQILFSGCKLDIEEPDDVQEFEQHKLRVERRPITLQALMDGGATKKHPVKSYRKIPKRRFEVTERPSSPTDVRYPSRVNRIVTLKRHENTPVEGPSTSRGEPSKTPTPPAEKKITSPTVVSAFKAKNRKGAHDLRVKSVPTNAPKKSIGSIIRRTLEQVNSQLEVIPEVTTTDQGNNPQLPRIELNVPPPLRDSRTPKLPESVQRQLQIQQQQQQSHQQRVLEAQHIQQIQQPHPAVQLHIPEEQRGVQQNVPVGMVMNQPGIPAQQHQVTYVEEVQQHAYPTHVMGQHIMPAPYIPHHLQPHFIDVHGNIQFLSNTHPVAVAPVNVQVPQTPMIVDQPTQSEPPQVVVRGPVNLSRTGESNSNNEEEPVQID